MMNKQEIILIGAGGHARSCIDVIEQQGQYSIAGLVGMAEEMHSRHLGYPVIATDKELAELARQYHYALITVGQIHSPDKRIQLYQQAIELGYVLPVIIAPSAYVSRHATLGCGTIVMHKATLNAGVRVGNNCIINSHALIEHDAIVDDYCHISTGVMLNGGVKIGAGSFIGSGSVMKEGVTVGARCIVGMSSAVRHNMPDHARFVAKTTV